MGILEFLHIVLNIPNPKIIAAKIINGTKMKKLDLRPMIQMKVLTIKLSVSFNSNSECANSFWIL